MRRVLATARWPARRLRDGEGCVRGGESRCHRERCHRCREPPQPWLEHRGGGKPGSALACCIIKDPHVPLGCRGWWCRCCRRRYGSRCGWGTILWCGSSHGRPDLPLEGRRCGQCWEGVARGGRAIAAGRQHHRHAVGVLHAVDGVRGWGRGGSNEFERGVVASLDSTGGEVWAEPRPHARIGSWIPTCQVSAVWTKAFWKS